jgi:hypothetical protein
MIKTIPPQVSIAPKTTVPPTPISNKVTDIAKGAFTILTTPGFFSSPEFYHGVEVTLGTVSCLGVIGTVIYVFAGKMDSASLSGIVVVTSATSAHLAGQVAIAKSMQEKLEKMENLNSQQAAQIVLLQTLSKEFKRDVEDFRDSCEQNKDTLTNISQKYEEKLQASAKLLDKIAREDLKDFIRVIKEIKDPAALLCRLNELETITNKLENTERKYAATQQEIANAEGRLEMVIANLREMEFAHEEILAGHKEVLAAHVAETNKLQAFVAAI